ncbi:MAG: 4Fe-4S dicluster domain-containing protein [Nautiliaceae bacterium]|jgi:Fe-S-cluster-containing dehydrogenase component
MANYAIALEYQNCIDCRACEVACKDENGVMLGADKQRIWVGVVEGGETLADMFLNFYPSQCNHCIDAPCVTVCPTGASHFAEGGIVKVDYDMCIICKGCMEACPYEARFVDETRHAVDKCTFCDGRIQEFGTTACSATCPTKVRTFGDLEDPESDIRKLLENRKFFLLKEDEKTLPKLFYLVPEDEEFARRTIGEGIKFHTWSEIEEKYKKATQEKKPEWKKA